MKIRLAGTVKESIVDGPGLRYTIFAQGCEHNCSGCHNPHTHDIMGGKMYEIDDILSEINDNPLLDGVTFSGGEPFLQPAEFLEIARQIPDNLNIYCFTGYLFEDLLKRRDIVVQQLISEIDVLVDGPFIESERSIELRFKGSRNQRLIDCKKSLVEGRVVVVEE